MDNVFEQVTEYLCNAHMNEVLMNNKTYLQADEKVDKIQSALREMVISKETKEVINQYIDAYVRLMTINVELAYRQGMRDLADFVMSVLRFDIEK